MGHGPGRRARLSWKQVELEDGWKWRRKNFGFLGNISNLMKPHMEQTNIEAIEPAGERMSVNVQKKGCVEMMI